MGNKLSKKEIKQFIAKLEAERQSVSGPAMTGDERIATLERIYDRSLSALESAMVCGIYTGTASLVTIMERCRLEVSELRKSRTSASHGDIGWVVKYEYDLPENRPTA